MESRYAAAERRSGQQKSRRKTSPSTNWLRRIDPALGSQGIQTKLRQTNLRDRSVVDVGSGECISCESGSSRKVLEARLWIASGWPTTRALGPEISPAFARWYTANLPGCDDSSRLRARGSRGGYGKAIALRNVPREL